MNASIVPGMPSSPPFRAVLAVVLLALLPASCSIPPAGASDANLAKAKSAASKGAQLFAGQCAGCHGERGEGIGSTPPVMGAGALPKFPRSKTDKAQTSTDPAELQSQYQTKPPGAPDREPFDNARDVFDYVSENMPPKSPGSLRPAEYWAIVSFVLAAHGSPVPEGGVTEGNATQVKIRAE